MFSVEICKIAAVPGGIETGELSKFTKYLCFDMFVLWWILLSLPPRGAWIEIRNET